jgi:hypothetical protein
MNEDPLRATYIADTATPPPVPPGPAPEVDDDPEAELAWTAAHLAGLLEAVEAAPFATLLKVAALVGYEAKGDPRC